jgi:hypothetical protein
MIAKSRDFAGRETNHFAAHTEKVLVSSDGKDVEPFLGFASLGDHSARGALQRNAQGPGEGFSLFKQGEGRLRHERRACARVQTSECSRCAGGPPLIRNPCCCVALSCASDTP